MEELEIKELARIVTKLVGSVYLVVGGAFIQHKEPFYLYLIFITLGYIFITLGSEWGR
jgi:hypothetical protein